MRKNKQENYRSYHKTYETRTKGIYLLASLLVLAEIAVCLLLIKDVVLCFLFIGIGLLFMGLLVLMQRNDDRYISKILMDLSAVLEQLMELKQKEIFPVEEDSMISKFQNQILEIIRMLRLQNENETKEHENIKGLVSDLSHQIKTPLATLKIYMEFLKKEELSKEERLSYVHILNQSLERLVFLSEGMIKISRLESGLISIDIKKTSVNDTILVAIKNAYSKAKEKQIELQYIEEYHGEVNHDAKWTSEAIFNLIENAIKYGKSNDKVMVGVRRLGASVEIFVEDENPKIEAGEYNLLFKRFYRGKNAADVEGAGIGLYLTRDIIIRQGGYVSVKAGKNGNRFVIVLPVS